MIEWIIFDVMGVIFVVGDDTNDLLVPFIQEQRPEIPREEVKEKYRLASLGQMTSQQFWSDLGFASEYPKIEQAYLDSCLTIDPGFIKVADRLSRNYKLALLSNDLSEWSAYLRKKYCLDRFITTAVISGDVGHRKPDAHIYRALLEKIGAHPSACVFVDDRTKNLRPASDLGINTIRFNRECAKEDFNANGTIRSFEELPGLLKRMR